MKGSQDIRLSSRVSYRRKHRPVTPQKSARNIEYFQCLQDVHSLFSESDVRSMTTVRERGFEKDDTPSRKSR